MLPQFFDLLGLHTQGLTFERIFWALAVCAGVVVCARELRAKRAFGDAWYGWAIGLILVGFGGFRLGLALFARRLYFGEEGLQISSYGVAIALAFIFGIWVAIREARRSPDPPDVGHIFDLSFWILIFSMVGGRVLFIISDWRDYYNLCVSPDLVPGSGGHADCLAVLKFWKGGLVFFGGIIGAVVTAVVYCRRQRISFLRTSDVMIPSVALGHFFGRLGCLSAGCCFGRPCSVPWAIVMPSGSAAFVGQYQALQDSHPQAALALLNAGHSLPIHPTELYEATAELLFFGLLLFLRPRKRFHGQLLAVWLVLYSILRFIVEFYRGDVIRGFLVEVAIGPMNRLLGIDPSEPTLLTTSQTISIAGVILGVVLYLRGRRTARELTAAPG
jgi:phosphatidylglycerol:prolipoprotein diacylglycerol transferase